MKKLKLLAIPTLLCLTAKSFAFFCPNNFQQINYGDSIEAVEKACGKPAKITKLDPPDNSPQEWSYYVPQTGLSSGPNTNQGTNKTTLTFDSKGKAINITINNTSSGAIKMCGTTIKNGMTREEVEAACGKPGFINKQTQANTQDTNEKENDKNKVIEYLYDATQPVTLIFEKGVLTGKR